MKFSKEYNKLSYPVFTTIRQNKGYYKQGQTIKVYTPKQEFMVEILSIVCITKKQMTDTISHLDAECSREYLLSMLERWYGKNADEYILLTLGKRSLK